MNNSLYDVICKGVLTLVVCVSLTCVCVHLYNISDTLNQIKECEYQIKEYPTLKNIEVQTEKVDSLMQTLER